MSTHKSLSEWLEKKGWSLLPFQKEVWKAITARKSGLVSVPTGAGKTYAAYLPALTLLEKNKTKGMQLLYITPLKALAKDIEIALNAPIIDMKLPFTIERRTGDTSSSQKSRQKKSPPDILLTTPESLSLLFTQKEAKHIFSNLKIIIVDEWHEFMGTKRGAQLELALAHLKSFSPNVLIWALTATIGNPLTAAQVAVGNDRIATLVTAQMAREVVIEPILPESIVKLPWAGYLGLNMLPYVIDKLNITVPTLIFTNTRSQAERWYRAIIEARPEWQAFIALHHSSIDKKTRVTIEENIKNGTLAFVVCTSALDLGIDLPTVQKVIQIGSPKSIARLIQRAGRASHTPLTPCHIHLVPTHALQVLEIQAYKEALKKKVVEERTPLINCYDVLLQHMTSCAIGTGFNKFNFYDEIKTTACFTTLSEGKYTQCLDFLVTGGSALTAYSEYHKLIELEDHLSIIDPFIIRRHRMNVGTIASSSYVTIKMLKGKPLGTIEETFISQMKVGDNFLFAGKKLKLVQYSDMTAYVRQTNEKESPATAWAGLSLPFSTNLGDLLRQTIEDSDKEGEGFLVNEIITIQKKKSHLPKRHELLIEIVKSQEGWHLFVFPFEGKMMHEGLALLIASRLGRKNKATFTISCNDYGFELLSKSPVEVTWLVNTLFSNEGVVEELEKLINLHETSKRAFRGIAQIAGLVFQGYPGKQKSHRQLQMSTGLLFEVLEKYDPKNLLLEQAKEETLKAYTSNDRLVNLLKRLQKAKIFITYPKRFTPFSFPIFLERVSMRLSTETLAKRIENIQKSWHKKI